MRQNSKGKYSEDLMRSSATLNRIRGDSIWISPTPSLINVWNTFNLFSDKEASFDNYSKAILEIDSTEGIEMDMSLEMGDEGGNEFKED